VVTAFWLLIAVAVVIAGIALIGARPRGARPVARTGLMSAARVVLALLALLLAYAAFRG
jgi:hypothetical protein